MTVNNPPAPAAPTPTVSTPASIAQPGYPDEGTAATKGKLSSNGLYFSHKNATNQYTISTPLVKSPASNAFSALSEHHDNTLQLDAVSDGVASDIEEEVEDPALFIDAGLPFLVPASPTTDDSASKV